MPSYQEENGGRKKSLDHDQDCSMIISTSTSRFFPEAQVSRMDFKPVQPGSSDDPFDSKNGLISQVRWRQRLPLVIKMIITDHHDNYCQSSKRSLSIIKMIIINHQKDPHRSSKRSSPGERLPHWSLLPDQLRLGQLLDIHHWGSVFMLSWPLSDPYWQPGNRGHG